MRANETQGFPIVFKGFAAHLNVPRYFFRWEAWRYSQFGWRIPLFGMRKHKEGNLMDFQRFRLTIRFSSARKMLGKPSVVPSSRHSQERTDFQ